jgi:ADP-heptose:LPS heptosyltransferase
MPKRILILSHDNKIGDAIVATGLFKPLRAHWPDCEIGVLCGPSNAALYRHHPDVKWLHVSASRNVFARMWASVKARLVGYDMVVHFGLDLANPSQQIVLKMVNAKQRFLFAKHPVNPLPNDVVIHGISEDSHYSERHIGFLRALNIAPSKYQYDIRFEQPISSLKVNRTGSLLVINSQSSTPNRSLSLTWLHDFVSNVCKQHPTMTVQLLSASPSHETDLIKTMSDLGQHVSVAPFHPSVSHSLKIISTADVVVTPDTYAVHAASAWNIPMVALYLPSGPTKVWTPLCDTYVQIEAAPGEMVSDIRVSDVMATLNEVMTTPHSRRHVHSG